jgi:hypothetical protein
VKGPASGSLRLFAIWGVSGECAQARCEVILKHLREVVRGHEKIPIGGQVEVSSFGQIKVSTPCSSCRSGTAGPDGDGEGANHPHAITTAEFH